jgi:hypothetical protein
MKKTNFWKLLPILLASSLALSACSKENWTSVGDDFYVDSASAKRSGDIGAITIKYGEETGWYEFDCQTRKIIKKPDLQVDVYSPMGKASVIACSRWFEVWKR